MSVISYNAEKNRIKFDSDDIIQAKCVKAGAFKLWIDSNNVNIRAISIDHLDDILKDFGHYPKFGSAKGLIEMSDDFDELLEDFKDYMP